MEPDQPKAVQKAVRVGQLIDLYGPLLTDRQLQFVKLHYEEDLSFGEISREFGVSRQAVHDAVKHAEQALETYDSKLALSPEQAAARRESAGTESQGQPSAAPSGEAAKVKGLGSCIEGLEELHQRIERSGGVIYNADGIARDLGIILEKLRGLDAGE